MLGIGKDQALERIALRISCVFSHAVIAGRSADAHRKAPHSVLERLAERGAEAIVLACTELPPLPAG